MKKPKISKFLQEIGDEIDAEYTQTLRQAKITVMKTKAKHQNNPKTVKLANEALKALKEMEQDHLNKMSD